MGEAARRKVAPRAPATQVPGEDVVRTVDRSYLESLVGYNARRATLVILEVFSARMAVYDLRPVDFSILSLITHNPGITSRQLCTNLGIQPPNLVPMVGTLERRGLIRRQPHREDGRAMSLFLTEEGQALMREAENTAAQLEADATARLTARDRERLIQLLQKIYL
jgi:DNA-binding MarR family transcriptional regulator